MLEHLSLIAEIGERESNKLELRIGLAHGGGDGVIEASVGLRRPLVLGLDRVEDLPGGDLVLVTTLVAFAEFVSEATFLIPGEQARKYSETSFMEGSRSSVPWV